MEEYKSEAIILIENSKEKDETNNNESIEATETKDLMNVTIINNSQEKESEKDQSAQNEDNESSKTNSRKSSLNSIQDRLQDNLNDLKTPMTISMEDLDDEKEIEFKRILLSVDFEDQCEKVENDEKVMKPSAETKITVHSSTTNSRKSSLNSIQDNLNDLKTPMTISMEDLDDEKEIEFKRILLSVDFEDQCEKVENDEKVMKPSAETKITVNGQSDPFRRRSETYTISPLREPKINKLSKLKTNLIRIGGVLLILGVLTGVGFTIANMFGWEFSHSSQNVEGVKLKQVEMEIHSYSGVGPCGSKAGVLAKLHHNSGYCEVKPYGSFDAGATIKWKGSELGDCNNFKFDPKNSEIDLYIKTKENDKFCPTSVTIVLDDGKDTTYNLDLPEGLYHNKGEKDTKKYSAKKL